MALEQLPAIADATADVEIVIASQYLRRPLRAGSAFGNRWRSDRPLSRQHLGKFGKGRERLPIGAAFGLHPGLAVGAAFGDPLPDLVRADRSVFLLVCADDPIHGCLGL